MEGVGAIADQIEREFPALLKVYYDGEKCLRSLYRRHKKAPANL
jgi:hypothetical protein